MSDATFDPCVPGPNMVPCDIPNYWILLEPGNVHDGWVFTRTGEGCPIYSVRKANAQELAHAALKQGAKLSAKPDDPRVIGANLFKEELLEASNALMRPHIEGVFAAFKIRLGRGDYQACPDPTGSSEGK